jgi:alkylation response protein AidB-like acyl-CoA dehydrogenase
VTQLDRDAEAGVLDDADYGVPWALDDHHRDWQRVVRAFCTREVAPGAAARSVAGTFEPDLARAAGVLGAYGLLAEERFGGGGADLRTLCVTAEELARVDSSLAVTVHVQAISVALLAHLAAGREDLLREVLPDACTGGTFVSFGLTEPSGGSDAGAITTTARRDGDDWLISGSKQFITNSGTPFSRYVILFAATGDATAGANGRSRRPVSAFLVPLQAPGVTVGPP